MRKLCRFSQLSLVGMYSWKTQLIQMEFRISILWLQQADFCFVLKRRYYLPRNNPYRISGITFRMRFIMVPSEVMETLSMLRLEKNHTALFRYGSPRELAHEDRNGCTNTAKCKSICSHTSRKDMCLVLLYFK